MEDIIITGSICLLLYGIMKLNKDAKERKMMIQMGMNPSQPSVQKEQNNTLGLLKWGIVFAGIGLGLLIAEMCAQCLIMDKNTTYVSMVFIFGGISFIISHITVARQIKKNQEKSEKDSKTDQNL